MTRFAGRRPFILSYQVLRSGIASFQSATSHDIAKTLNKVTHCCLNVFASSAFFVLLMVLVDKQGLDKTPKCLAALYAFAMWMQLATVRYRHFIPLILTVVIELVITGLVSYQTGEFIFSHTAEVKDYVFTVMFTIIAVFRFVFIIILFKVLIYKNPPHSLTTTVLLKPTNIPVTFSSIKAPQELDPTNPYYPQTVYNSNQSKNNLLPLTRD